MWPNLENLFATLTMVGQTVRKKCGGELSGCLVNRLNIYFETVGMFDRTLKQKTIWNVYRLSKSFKRFFKVMPTLCLNWAPESQLIKSQLVKSQLIKLSDDTSLSFNIQGPQLIKSRLIKCQRKLFST